MKCKGTSNLCGAECPACSRFADDCDGNPEYADFNGQWLPVEDVEKMVTADLAESIYKREKE